MAVIVPEKGQTRSVARRLLDLADDPHQIGTSAEGPDGVTFVVPDDLYEKYMSDDKDQVAVEVTESEEPAEEKPKRRGRPPGSRNKPKDSEE